MTKTCNKFDKLAKFYNMFFIQIFYFLAYKQIFKIIKEFIKEKRRILDIGCGTGNFLHKIRKINKTTELIGIDQSKEMIKISKRKFKDISFFLNDKDDLPFKENYFDLVTIIDAFYYFKNKDKLIFECHRILKQKAYLFIYMPSADGFFQRLLLKSTKWLPTETESEHLCFAELKNIAEKHGFSIVVKKSKCFPFTPLKYWLLILTKAPELEKQKPDFHA